MPTVALHTLGCKLNYAETSAIARQFLDRGFQLVDFGMQADVTVLNTCSVTDRADRECRQLIRRSRRASRNSFVLVTGCYAQLEPEEVASIEGVSAVLGSTEKFRIFDHLRDFALPSSPKVFVSDVLTNHDFGPAFSSEGVGRTRAFLKIQDGCDFNCSFCTIPLARGGSRSQDPEECLAQARMLVSQGYKEIVLTGVNVGDYGKASNRSLLGLLRDLEKVPGLERVRISSIEPNLLSDDLIRFVAGSSAVCHHFHIPLQSGDDAVLRSMRRRYHSAQYQDLIGRIKQAIPDCGIGVDVIVGFPGETDGQFERTCNFIENLPVSYLHVFTYSERPNTPASAFSNPVRPEVRYHRSRVLRMLGQRKKVEFHQAMVGQTEVVLFESQTESNLRFGFTRNYVRVGVPETEAEENTLRTVQILEAGIDSCVGIPLCDRVAV